MDKKQGNIVVSAHAADAVAGTEPTSTVVFTVPTASKRRWLRAARRAGGRGRGLPLAEWVAKACDAASAARCPHCGGELEACGEPDAVTGDNAPECPRCAAVDAAEKLRAELAIAEAQFAFVDVQQPAVQHVATITK